MRNFRAVLRSDIEIKPILIPIAFLTSTIKRRRLNDDEASSSTKTRRTRTRTRKRAHAITRSNSAQCATLIFVYRTTISLHAVKVAKHICVPSAPMTTMAKRSIVVSSARRRSVTTVGAPSNEETMGQYLFVIAFYVDMRMHNCSVRGQFFIQVTAVVIGVKLLYVLDNNVNDKNR